MPEQIEITFLGTSDSIPTKKRNHTGILISWKSENILFDCGEGIQRQFRVAGINPCKLTRILLTHWHGDHVLGLPGLLSTLGTLGYSKILKIYGPIGIKEKFQLLEKLYGKFRLNYELHEVSGRFLDEKEFFLEAAEMEHGTRTNAYSFTLKNKLRIDKRKLGKLKIPNSPLIGKLQEGKDIVFNGKKIKAKDVVYLQKGKKITLIVDTGKNNNAVKLAKDSDVFICEATFLSSEEDIAREYKHLTAKQTAEIARKAKVGKLYIIHISQRYEQNQNLILKEAKKIFKQAYLAKDFDKIIF